MTPFALIGVATVADWGSRVSSSRWLRALALLCACGSTLAAMAQEIATAAGVLSLCAFYFLCTKTEERLTKKRDGIARAMLWLSIILAFCFGTHRIAGFQPVSLPLGPGDSTQLYFDIPAVGYILFTTLCKGRTCGSFNELREALRVALLPAVMTAIVLPVIALVTGLGKVTFHWNQASLIVIAVNLVFVCVAEESLFRGIFFSELAFLLGRRALSERARLLASSALFGLAHMKWGLVGVVVVTAAGIGYGSAYKRSGRLESSIMAHWLLNVVVYMFLQIRS